MKLLEREHIDLVRWDALVNQSAETCFSYSWYMDSVADRWCVLVNSDYTKGMALPYATKAGVDILYCPIFGMYSEQLGGRLQKADVDVIKARFKVIEFTSRKPIFEPSQSWKHQVIRDFEAHKFGSQAVRSSKKVVKENNVLCVMTDNERDIFDRIRTELNGKFKGIDDDALNRLGFLFHEAKRRGVLHAFNIIGEKHYGGVICFESNGRLLYIKGAVEPSVMKNGGMYLAMTEAINYAKEKNLIFDFGGSNTEGVRKFNCNLGGEDEAYAAHFENNGPLWFKIGRALKNRLKG